jgi:glycosyltransferase involved in cell wall biosynthesis
MCRGVNPYRDLATLRQLREIFRQQQPTIVHAFDTKPSIYAVWAAAQADVPVRIRTITGLGSVFSRNDLQCWLMAHLLIRLHRSADRLCHLTVFYNHSDLEFALRRRWARTDRSLVVPGSGIDLEVFQGHLPDEQRLTLLRTQLSPQGGPIVLMAGRLLWEKGVREFLAAASRVKQSVPAAQFYLIGPIEPAGRRTIPHSLLQSSEHPVRWLGHRNDLPALLAAADLVVLPTYYGEGIPRLILEAGAAGRAVITTSVPGCTEVIQHGHNGWLIPARDVESLAAAMCQLLHNPLLRSTLGNRLAADVAQRFSLERIVATWLSIYAECCNREGVCGPQRSSDSTKKQAA